MTCPDIQKCFGRYADGDYDDDNGDGYTKVTETFTMKLIYEANIECIIILLSALCC